MCFKIYFDIYLIIVIYFMNFMNFDFIFKFFLLQRKKIYTLKLIVALNVWLLRHIWLQSFFHLSLRQLSIQGDLHSMWVAQLVQFASKWFFQSPFQGNKMFCLPNKFVVRQTFHLITFLKGFLVLSDLLKPAFEKSSKESS